MNWYKNNVVWKKIIRSRFYESDYKNITEKLLYEDFSYEAAINQGISLIVKSDLLNNF